MIRRATWIQLLVAVGAVSVLTDCDTLGQSGLLGDVASASCPELSGGVDAFGAIYGPGQINGKIRAFVQASKDLHALALQAEAEAADACTRIGMDLGLSPQQMAPRDEAGGRASGACAAVSARLDAILASGVRFQASVVPPQCQANASAYASCSGQCSGSVDPGQIVATCEPGRLSGYCQGRCVGRCEGRCNGECRGQCMQRDLQGRCVGACNGDCVGGCDATCHARCEGQWQAPRCEGSVQGPSADAECNASCKAQSEFRASCTPAQVTVQSNATNMARVIASLQANLPILIHAQVALGKRVLADADAMVQVGNNLPGMVGNAGAHAAACIAGAANMSARASMSIKVSVQASASVSAKAGAGG